MNTIDVEKTKLKKACAQETALRASCVAAVELLKSKLNESLSENITSSMLDAYLRLNFGIKNAPEGNENEDTLALHLTSTEAY
mmetsp:Transcript_31261/g.38634  ORF Transcript_31261/g.38634 Transcript_31261/m.38634 type:complete len:83 (+) Transcript_31261:1060-1308(+)